MPTFPWLNPGGLFTDTLSSVEGEDREVHPAKEPLPEQRADDGEQGDNEGDMSNLMQRSGKRKRGSPEPAPRGAGSTASSSWHTLQPPRKTPRARGRGRRAISRGRPIIPTAKARPENTDHCEGEEEQEVEVEEEAPPEGGATSTTLPDEEIHNGEEHFQQLRQVVGVGSESDEDTTPLGFSPHSLDELQALWTRLAAGNSWLKWGISSALSAK